MALSHPLVWLGGFRALLKSTSLRKWVPTYSTLPPTQEGFGRPCSFWATPLSTSMIVGKRVTSLLEDLGLQGTPHRKARMHPLEKLRGARVGGRGGKRTGLYFFWGGVPKDLFFCFFERTSGALGSLFQRGGSLKPKKVLRTECGPFLPQPLAGWLSEISTKSRHRWMARICETISSTRDPENYFKLSRRLKDFLRIDLGDYLAISLVRTRPLTFGLSHFAHFQ